MSNGSLINPVTLGSMGGWMAIGPGLNLSFIRNLKQWYQVAEYHPKL